VSAADRNLWVPGAEGDFPADVARTAIEDYWRFRVAPPERPVVRECRPDLPDWEANCPGGRRSGAAPTRTGGGSSNGSWPAGCLPSPGRGFG
jgi:hypothetical protein